MRASQGNRVEYRRYQSRDGLLYLSCRFKLHIRIALLRESQIGVVWGNIGQHTRTIDRSNCTGLCGRSNFVIAGVGALFQPELAVVDCLCGCQPSAVGLYRVLPPGQHSQGDGEETRAGVRLSWVWSTLKNGAAIAALFSCKRKIITSKNTDERI